MEVLIYIWLGLFAAVALVDPGASGRFADRFVENVHEGFAWLMRRR